MSPPTLILGIGNLLLKDEGVGVHVVQALRGRKIPDGVEVVDGGTFGLDLIDIFAGRRKVIFIDAMLSKAPPATVLRFSP